MADISALAEAIATRVKTIATLANRASAFGKDFTDPPWAVIVPDPGEFITYDSTMAGQTHDMTFVIKVIETAAEDRAAQGRLTSYCDTDGSSSMKLAVDSNLGGLVAYAKVTTARNFGNVMWGGLEHYGCEFPVAVWL